MATDQLGQYDVAIVGGGPAGTTVGTLLRRHNPALRVLILEKEKFPRDHIGESQLPAINGVLVEMGVWDKVEAANFPVKIGASYTWGRDNERWDFEFYPVENWAREERPVRFEGQRKYTAFQVDRAIYDEILLRHAEEVVPAEATASRGSMDSLVSTSMISLSKSVRCSTRVASTL